ncbi:hypothetical protein INR79_09665 [Vibrio sp. SCSIO 43132]|uniref:hypothetical protein n=1 Tax=Vibrio sp. SCSIO 43132 TaxID=2779363 RepID=UPI001CA986CF|nr:hypothetical protein [Vibrio sp. SCSIO 43132]UAB68815.1 hypothetical protein INR79_09665 [Vibrio sp. SCSIO 43132]
MSVVDTELMDQVIDEHEAVDTHSTDEELALIQAMGAEDDEFNPDAAVSAAASPPPTKAQQIEALEEDAAMLVGGAEYLIQQAVHPALSFGEPHSAALAKATAPILHKYGGELPPWLKPYKEELGFVVALATAGGSMFFQYRAIKQAEEAAKVKESKEENHETD